MKRWRHYKKDTAIILSAFGSIPQKAKYESLKEYIENNNTNIPVHLAFSSRSVLNNLKTKGIIYKNLSQTLSDVELQGYKRIIASSINLFPTDEHELIKNTVKGFNIFSPADIRFSPAILSRGDETSRILYHINQYVRKNYNDVILYLVHGAPYFEQSGIQSVFYAKDFLTTLNPLNLFSSLEKIYNFSLLKDSIIDSVKRAESVHKKKLSIKIVPLLLTSGNHFIKDVKKIENSLSKNFNVLIAEVDNCPFNLLDLDIVKETIKNLIDELKIKMGTL